MGVVMDADECRESAEGDGEVVVQQIRFLSLGRDVCVSGSTHTPSVA